jgi:hypothetical protein
MIVLMASRPPAEAPITIIRSIPAGAVFEEVSFILPVEF